MSFPALFFALSSVALIAALAAIWNSLRVALGGGRALVLDTARDLPDHAALVEEKNSLLRAIKDLEYEHAVGKTSDADYQRLDTAYRARAKQVLAQLDRDVKPLYEQAERLIAERIGAPAASVTIEEPSAPSPPAERAEDDAAWLDEIVDGIREGRIKTAEDLPQERDGRPVDRVDVLFRAFAKLQKSSQGEERSE